MNSAFFKFLNKSGLLDQLKNKIALKSKDHPNYENLFTSLENLDQLILIYNNYNDNIVENIDFFSYFYQRFVSKSVRKDKGEFYTPTSIVDYILDALNFISKWEIENFHVIDPSCGSGSFLVRVIQRLVERFLKQYDVVRICELNITQAKKIIVYIREKLYGIDINPVACLLCQLNIYFALFDLISFIREEEPSYNPKPFKIFHMNALQLLDNPPRGFPKKGFDIVLGNPPYVFIRSISKSQKKLIDSLNLKTNQGQYDYYQIFLELGINLLKKGGKLGFIVPDSLLALSNRRIARKFIMDKTIIEEINYKGEQFDNLSVSNIILILKKEQLQSNRLNNLMNIKTSTNHMKLKQKRFKDWDYKFLINLTEKDIPILKHLSENFPNLKDLMRRTDFEVKLQRGVEISKEGQVFFCESCEKYFPLPKSKKKPKCRICGTKFKEKGIQTIIKDVIPKNDPQKYFPFIYSINRYQITEYKFIRINVDGINYKSLDLYKDRILIRQISENRKICATYDNNLSLTTQSIYNLKLAKTFDEGSYFNQYYLLGLLNSELLSYYFLKRFGSYKRLFPRILIEKIKHLPILIPQNQLEIKKANTMSNLVKEILEIAINKDKLLASYQEKLKEIDELIFELYGINEEQKKLYIEKALNSK